MELELQWDGNPNIVLDIQTTLGISLPVQIMEGKMLVTIV
uniref:SMP-LTD domain-containing protein n=1 Tax=Setaria italica TaxID=4555 RepID=K3YNW9_SETIT